MAKKPKMQKSKCELTMEDLSFMKEMCRTILNCNIAVKEFQLQHCENETQEKWTVESLTNSKNALKVIDTIENPECINEIIMRQVGVERWQYFVQVLGVFSGSLADQSFYDWDKHITEYKKSGTSLGEA